MAKVNIKEIERDINFIPTFSPGKQTLTEQGFIDHLASNGFLAANQFNIVRYSADESIVPSFTCPLGTFSLGGAVLEIYAENRYWFTMKITLATQSGGVYRTIFCNGAYYINQIRRNWSSIAPTSTASISSALNNEDMTQNNVIEHMGGGVTAFSIGDYAVTVRQKGGQRNGKGEHSKCDGATSPEYNLLQRTGICKVRRSTMGLRGLRLQFLNFIGYISDSGGYDSSAVQGPSKWSFVGNRNKRTYNWRTFRTNLHPVQRWCHVCERFRNNRTNSLEKSHSYLAQREEVVA